MSPLTVLLWTLFVVGAVLLFLVVLFIIMVVIRLRRLIRLVDFFEERRFQWFSWKELLECTGMSSDSLAQAMQLLIKSNLLEFRQDDAVCEAQAQVVGKIRSMLLRYLQSAQCEGVDPEAYLARYNGELKEAIKALAEFQPLPYALREYRWIHRGSGRRSFFARWVDLMPGSGILSPKPA